MNAKRRSHIIAVTIAALCTAISALLGGSAVSGVDASHASSIQHSSAPHGAPCQSSITPNGGGCTWV